MRFNILLGIIASFLLNIVIADERNSYLTDSSGNPVITHNNECVRTPRSPNTPPIWQGKCYGQNNIVIKEIINLPSDVMFAFNKATLNPQARDFLANIVAKIDIYALKSIGIVGHTDSIGSKSYNQKLSDERARNVANYFFRAGVPANKIYYYGEGELDPIMPNNTEIGRAMNRRVTINIR